MTRKNLTDRMAARAETYGKLWPILTALTVCLSSFSLGAALGYSAPAMPNLNDHPNPFHVNIEQLSWVGGIMSLGALMGSLVGGPLMDKFGRKMTQMYVAIPFALAWVVISSSPNFACLMIGQMLSGICAGIYSITSPVYIAEISPASIRGVLGSCYQLGVCLGILFSYCFGAFLTWSWLAIACETAILVMIAFLAFVPESPRWLLSVGRKDEAKYVLLWLYGEDYDVVLAIDELQKVIESSRDTATFREFLQPQILNPLLIGMGLMIIQQFCGINVILFFTVEIFRMAKIDINSYLQGIAVGVVSVLGTLVSVSAADLAGRRVLLLASALVMALSIGGLGAYFHELDVRPEYATGTLSWLPITCMVIFTFGYHAGFGPVPWLMMGELFPLRARGVSIGIAGTCNWFFTFITIKYFFNVTQTISVAGGYWCFAGCCILGIPFVLVIPETKGKTLEEIELSFRKRKGPIP